MIRKCLPLLAALGLCAARAAHATVFIDSPTTINYLISDYTLVGYNNTNPFNVDITTGGSIDNNLQANNAATISMSDGSITGRLITADNSRASVSGGMIGYGLLADNDSLISVSAATIGDVEAQDNGQITLAGGTVQQYLQASGSGTITNSGAAIGQYVNAQVSGVINLRGGSVAQYVQADDQSFINVYGGSVSGYFQVNSSGTINIYGSNLMLTNPTSYTNGTQYTLTGFLQDGTPLNNTAITTANGAIVLHNVAATPSPAPCRFSRAAGSRSSLDCAAPGNKGRPQSASINAANKRRDSGCQTASSSGWH